VSRLCGQYLHSLGIPEPLHSLRHYFGSSLYAASQDLRLTQEVRDIDRPSDRPGPRGAMGPWAVRRSRSSPRVSLQGRLGWIAVFAAKVLDDDLGLLGEVARVQRDEPRERGVRLALVGIEVRGGEQHDGSVPRARTCNSSPGHPAKGAGAAAQRA